MTASRDLVFGLGVWLTQSIDCFLEYRLVPASMSSLLVLHPAHQVSLIQVHVNEPDLPVRASGSATVLRQKS